MLSSSTWRTALRRVRRWWSGQTRARQIPLAAGGASLLCAVSCCCLLIPAALRPDHEIAAGPAVASTLSSDSSRVGAVALETEDGASEMSVQATEQTDTSTRPAPSATLRAPSATPRPATATRRPTQTAVPTATLDPIASAEQVGVVVDVIDGDTIEVEIEGEAYRVRYIGIDAPEAGATCGDEATDLNADLVEGQTVRLVRDVSPTDRYDRLLRYVYVDDVFVNAELIKRGAAEAKRYPPDTAQALALETAEAEARAGLPGCYALGVFGGAPAAAAPTTVTRAETIPLAPVADTPVPIADTPVPAPTVAPELPTAEPPTAAPPPANCDPSYPDVCIPPKPPDLNCKDIPYRRFRVLPPDPHGFDGNGDGVGCESD